jgi:hypothetical protein
MAPGRVLTGRLLSFDGMLGWGRVASVEGTLYLVRANGFVNGCPPIGAEVEFVPVHTVHAREARQVRRIRAAAGKD